MSGSGLTESTNNIKKHPARIGVPLNPSLLIFLAVAIKLEHDRLVREGKTSPLAGLKWEENGPVIEAAAKVDKRMTEIGKELEKLTEERKIMVEDTLIRFVRSSRDVLTGIFSGELHKLVDFGFQVDGTPRTKKSKDDKKAA